ncbi:phosphoglycerate kinase [Plakobranchus ocellatus]|uniref:phosphoglycerate kinase n=1 Tax=Plakobranchus ocellatus TaxID=259542 RepID=A0AAV3Z769_9GAST|nr:phosphoglycerate kinase [Plakobranchus ocellatus]
MLSDQVIFVPRTVGKDVMTTINQVHPGSVLMLENVRFSAEEEHGFLHLQDGRPKQVLAHNKSAGFFQAVLTLDQRKIFHEPIVAGT